MTLYEKRGRRYYPVSEYDEAGYHSLPAGFHLLEIHPGKESLMHNVTPDRVSVLAALRQHRDELCRVLMHASDARPRNRQLTPKEIRGFAAYRKIVGENSSMMLEYPSAVDIIDTLERRLVEKIALAEKHPAGSEGRS